MRYLTTAYDRGSHYLRPIAEGNPDESKIGAFVRPSSLSNHLFAEVYGPPCRELVGTYLINLTLIIINQFSKGSMLYSR